MKALGIGGFQSRPEERAGINDVLRVRYAVQRHGRRPQHIARELMDPLFERLLFRREGEAQIRVRSHGMPFFNGPPGSLGMAPTRLAIILLSSTEGAKNRMASAACLTRRSRRPMKDVPKQR